LTTVWPTFKLKTYILLTNDNSEKITKEIKPEKIVQAEKSKCAYELHIGASGFDHQK
jgi:hypothetical protein